MAMPIARLFVSASGRVVDGDAVLFLAGTALKNAGQLPGNLVVATVMSNLGLEKAFEAHGIQMLRTPVGDKYVLEEMLRRGAVLGGEQSGHVIFHAVRNYWRWIADRPARPRNSSAIPAAR